MNALRVAILVCMFGIVVAPAHAEVIDKIPEPGDFWFSAIVGSLAGFWACQKHPALGLITLVAGAMLPLAMRFDDDHRMTQAILVEAGPGYFHHAQAALGTIIAAHLSAWGFTIRRVLARDRQPN